MRNFWIGCAVIVICRLLASWILPTYDDAFITYRYAINFVAGHGLVYNIGERVMGSTAPLFALISSIPAFIHVSIPKFFVVFNTCCDICSLYIVYKFLLKDNALAFLLTVCFFAIDPMINRISIGGMEADLFLLLSLSGLALYFTNRKLYAFLLLPVLYFLRPEAVILLFILLCYDLYVTRKLPIVYGFMAIFILGLPIFFIYSYYGQALSQSVVAKSTMGRETIPHLIKNIYFPDPLFIAFVPLAIYGFLQQFKKSKFAFLVGLWAFSYSAAYLIRGPYVWSWYSFSIQFVMLVFAAIGTSLLIQKFLPPLANANSKFAYLLLLPLIVWIAVFAYKGRSGVETHVYSELEKDFGNDSSMKNRIIFADDIGAIGYFSHADIYDDVGLVTPIALRSKTVAEKMKASNADFIFIYSDPFYVNFIKKDSVLRKKYSFYKRYSINGETQAPEENPHAVQKNYLQDYTIFKKN